MRKLDLSNYTVKRKVPSKMNLAEEIEIELPFHVKTSILNVMFVPEQLLTNADLVRENILAMKLEACEEDEILLKEEEYQRLKKAFGAFKGFTRDAVELVRRISEAEEVEVEQVQEKGE